jgi:pyridoxal/pyridoxine/pyridoxamine kinase
MKPPKILCVHSLTVHGTVGLKPFLAALGAHCLPVPSLLLTGPGDMPGVRRIEPDFATLLDGALAACAARSERVVLVCGYLAQAGQIDTVLAAIERYREIIIEQVIDPVSGDHGRAYVGADLLAAWPRLLAVADWALPNRTELNLLGGQPDDSAWETWRTRFPALSLVVTSWEETETHITIRLFHRNNEQRCNHERLPGRYNGSGDLFAARWMRARYLSGLDPVQAVHVATAEVRAAILHARDHDTRDLVAI